MHAAHTPAVYASRRRSPAATQDSLPAVRPHLAGRESNPLGHARRFQLSLISSSFLLRQAYLAHRGSPLGPNSNGTKHEGRRLLRGRPCVSEVGTTHLHVDSVFIPIRRSMTKRPPSGRAELTPWRSSARKPCAATRHVCRQPWPCASERRALHQSSSRPCAWSSSSG